MAARSIFWTAALAAGVLFSGCRSQPGPAHPQAEARPVEPQSALDRRAEGHARFAMGVVDELNDQPALALDEYYKAAQADLGDAALVLEVTGRLLEQKKPESEKALRLLESAAARPNAPGEIFAQLGVVRAQLGQKARAIQANRKAIQKSPASMPGYRNLFLIYLCDQQPEGALQVAEEAAKQTGAGPAFLIEVAELYGNFALQFPKQREMASARGLAVLARIDRSKLGSPELRLSLADEFNQLGAVEQAAAIYLDLLKQYADSPIQREMVRAKLTDAYMRMSDRKHAAEQLQAMLRDDPSNVQAYHYLGVIALGDERWADAVENFRKALLFSQGIEQSYLDLAGAQIELGKPDDALATLDAARRKFPRSFALEFLCASAYAGQTNYAEAVNHFTAAEIVAEATAPNRLTDDFYSQVAAAQMELGRTNDAFATLDKARGKFPRSFSLERLYGMAYARQKNYAQATNHFRAAEIAAQTKSPELLTDGFYCQVAASQMELEKPGDALATLERARRKFPRDFLVEYFSGLAYDRQKNYGEAMTHLSAAEADARAKSPERLTDAFYFESGAVCERKGDITKATSYFEKCLKLNPNYADALNYLGYMWAERGMNLEKSRELIDKALKIEPTNAAFLDSMGWVLFKLNQPKEALEFILKAVQFIEAPDATVLDHLGDIQWALGEPEKAKEAWRKSLGLETNEQVRRKLESRKAGP